MCRAIVVAALLAASTPGLAATSGAATDAVRRALSQASTITEGEKTRAEELAALRTVARQLVDTHAMGRRAMGETLNAYTPAQREEFLELFDEVIVRAYLQKLLLFRDPRFRFGKEQPRGDGVTVFTEVLGGKDAYAVEYDMRERDGKWLATDVIVEGVSMAGNYGDQFSSLLRNRSFDELLELMRRKVGQLEAKDAK
jgi:phospholipid transport system substrate-binding protein